MSSNSFDLTQTVFLFNWISNSSCHVTGSEQQVADFVYDALTNGNVGNAYQDIEVLGLIETLGSQLIGEDWKVVWGPGVYEMDSRSGKADNTAFVVYSPSQDTYVVAIAGTDPSAFLDWFGEDFQVGPNDCVNWPNTLNKLPTTSPVDFNQSQISFGTAIGVYNLLNNLVQSSSAPNANQTLQVYLSELAPTSTTTKLIFTGHSLGGALAPTLASWFTYNNTKGWTAGTQVSALPTAGPTPGNAIFASNWDSTFSVQQEKNVNSGNNVNALNALVYNTQDIVPHAWEYLYSSTQAAEGAMQYYSWDDKALKDVTILIKTQLGDLIPTAADALYLVANACQTEGADADMTMTSNRISWTSSWPLTYYAALESGTSPTQHTLPLPPAPFSDFSTVKSYLGAIHVWGYLAAFGIDVTQPQVASVLTYQVVSDQSSS
ncbi:MAG TPA: hypothetical protein VIF37_00825 [Methylobacter sp.]|jgi:hypothetical protein